MQMKNLRDHPDMSYGSSKHWKRLCELSCFNCFTVYELNISKQRMLFAKIFISVQKAKKLDVRKLTAYELYTFS